MEGDVSPSSSQLSLRDEFSSDLLAKNSFEGRSQGSSVSSPDTLQQWCVQADMASGKRICCEKLSYFIR